jgi:hypothetical protein
MFCKVNTLFSLLLYHEDWAFRFRLGTGLISDDRRASAEVNGETLAELNNGWSLVFIKAGWFTGAASLSSEDRGKSYGLKVFLSQEKRPVARKPLAAVSLVYCTAQTHENISIEMQASLAACMHYRRVRQFGRRWRLALGVNGTIFQFLNSRMSSGAPWKLYPRVAFCGCCEVGGKWCQHDSLELK